MITTLTIITPCSRPQNLERMAESIQHLRQPGFLTRWLIVHDRAEGRKHIYWADEYNKTDNTKTGYYQCNFALNKVKYGWVCFLDDDNIVHPDLTVDFIKMLDDNIYNGAILPQVLPDGSIRTNTPETVKLYSIDKAQFLLRRTIIDQYFKNDYCADGIFIEDIFKKHPDDFFFAAKPMCYYNYLSAHK